MARAHIWGRMKIRRDPDWLAAAGARLERTRQAIGIQQADMARLMGMSQSRWNNYEKGRRPLDLDAAMELCDKFGLTLDWIYRGHLNGLPVDLRNKLLNEIPTFGANES